MDERLAMLPVMLKFFKGNPTHWTTWTFENPTVHVTRAEDALRFWLSGWRLGEQSRRDQRKGASPISRLAWCAELQSRGTAHIHALTVCDALPNSPHCEICFSGMVSNRRLSDFPAEMWDWAREKFRRSRWSERWPLWKQLKESWWLHHGIARIWPFDPARCGGVVGYLVKYMFKRVDTTWGLWERGKDF